jgi:hypothetical protein
MMIYDFFSEPEFFYKPRYILKDFLSKVREMLSEAREAYRNKGLLSISLLSILLLLLPSNLFCYHLLPAVIMTF